jgi:hypothetical protein
MLKNYIYRMDHDTGHAPRIVNNQFCFLSGCKMNTIEAWAKEGSWVIGVGGNHTHKPDMLIYGMKVDRKMPIRDFMKEFPEEKKHLINEDRATNVLLSKEFYYLGDRAVPLPKELEHLMIRTQGCKSKAFKFHDIETLKAFLHDQGFKLGRNGNPNNPKSADNPPDKKKPC